MEQKEETIINEMKYCSRCCKLKLHVKTQKSMHPLRVWMCNYCGMYQGE